MYPSNGASEPRLFSHTFLTQHLCSRDARVIETAGTEGTREQPQPGTRERLRSLKIGIVEMWVYTCLITQAFHRIEFKNSYSRGRFVAGTKNAQSLVS